MKVFGHPVHMMLIHFPSALLPMDFVCSVIHHVSGNASFLTASFFAGIGGAMMGWLAIVFGAWDLIKLSQNRQDVLSQALIHGGINAGVIIVFSIIVLLQYTKYPVLQSDSMIVIIIKAVSIGLMFIGNFIGARMILKYKVAVRE